MDTKKDQMETTAILLLHCPDQQGIISEVTKFITDNKGNIVYLDQYVDKVDGMFFMRIEWELEGFLIPRDKLYDYITTLYAQRYKMKFSLYYSDKRPRMAIFVSKMSHCLYDLLARWKAGEFNCDIPCIVSNHEDLRYVADQFGIPYYVWSIKKDHSNKAEVEKAEMDLLKKEEDDCRVSAPHHQHPPLVPAGLHRCEALPSGLRARSEDHRGHFALCDGRTRRWTDHRTGRDAHHTQGYA